MGEVSYDGPSCNKELTSAVQSSGQAIKFRRFFTQPRESLPASLNVSNIGVNKLCAATGTPVQLGNNPSDTVVNNEWDKDGTL